MEEAREEDVWQPEMISDPEEHVLTVSTIAATFSLRGLDSTEFRMVSVVYFVAFDYLDLSSSL